MCVCVCAFMHAYVCVSLPVCVQGGEGGPACMRCVCVCVGGGITRRRSI